MRNMTLLIILLAATFSHLAFSQNGADETAIRELIAQYLDIRAQNDEQALLAILTADADQLTTSGTLRTGRNGVSRGSLASSRNNSGNRSISVESIRFIKPDVVIVNGRYSILERDNTPDSHYLTTFVVLVEDGRWKISAIRNMQPTQ